MGFRTCCLVTTVLSLSRVKCKHSLPFMGFLIHFITTSSSRQLRSQMDDANSKRLLTKAAEHKEDFQLALLAYWSTPQESTHYSPAQLLMGSRLRTTLPASPSYLLPAAVEPSQVHRNDANSKENQALNYNRQHGARQLRTLQVRDRVMISDGKSQTMKIPAMVHHKLHDGS